MSPLWTASEIAAATGGTVHGEFDVAGATFDSREVGTGDLFIAMNDHLVNNRVIVPLVVAGEPRAVSRRLRQENIALAPFSGDYWNIANWNLIDNTEGS